MDEITNKAQQLILPQQQLPDEHTSLDMGEQTDEAEPQLPDDLIAQQILTKLPIKSVIRFKSVSKHWYSTLSSCHFAHLYSKISPFSQPSSCVQFLIIKNGTNCYLYSHDDDDEFITRKTHDNHKNLFKLRTSFSEKLDLIGSCNGLVCLASFSAYFFILWNPITGNVQEYIDHELVIDPSSPFEVTWGFGYVSSVDDYKAVRILELGATCEIRVHVFSLKSNKWTRIGDESYQDIFSLRSTSFETSEPGLMNGVLVDETVYWIVINNTDRSRKVISFDLDSEEFNAVANFNLRSTELYSDKFLCELGGCLAKCGSDINDDVHIIMLKSHGKQEFISLFRDLNLSSCQAIVGFTRTGKFFMMMDYSEFVLVDPCSKPKKCVPLVRLTDWGARIAGYIPALTLPYTATSRDLSG